MADAGRVVATTSEISDRRFIPAPWFLRVMRIGNGGWVRG
jgi:hypothetical protein